MAIFVDKPSLPGLIICISSHAEKYVNGIRPKEGCKHQMFSFNIILKSSKRRTSSKKFHVNPTLRSGDIDYQK